MNAFDYVKSSPALYISIFASPIIAIVFLNFANFVVNG